MKNGWTLALLGLLTTGCATHFFGKPTIEQGADGCRTVCSQWDMELAGMVQMGEYSNGCICQVKGKSVGVSAAAAAASAVAGVAMQNQRAQQAQAQTHR